MRLSSIPLGNWFRFQSKLWRSLGPDPNRTGEIRVRQFGQNEVTNLPWDAWVTDAWEVTVSERGEV